MKPDPDQHAHLPPDHRILRGRKFLSATLAGGDDLPIDLDEGGNVATIRRSSRSLARERGAAG